MSSKRKSRGKALPILSIVFFGVSLILFASKALAVLVTQYITGGYTLQQMLLLQPARTLALCFPAIFFIIYAGIYLHKKEKPRKLFSVCIFAQLLSLVLIIDILWMMSKRIVVSDSYSASIITVLIGICAVMCVMLLVTLVLMALHKEKGMKVMLILSAALGFVPAVGILVLNAYQIYVFRSYYETHLLELLLRIAKESLNVVAMVFYYIALLFTALFKPIRTPQRVKVVIAKTN